MFGSKSINTLLRKLAQCNSTHQGMAIHGALEGLEFPQSKSICTLGLQHAKKQMPTFETPSFLWQYMLTSLKIPRG
jgi:hypothetical protein